MFNYKNNLEYEINKIITNHVNKIHDFNEYFFQTRDKNRYKVAKKCNRSIIFEFGKMIFNHRVYWDKLNKEYYYPVYEEFNINKRAKIINWLKEEIISYLGKKKNYQDIQDILKYTYVSKVTISKIHKNIKIKEILPQEKIKVKDNEYIYINVDDCFVPVWNKNKKRELQKIRSISYNTGKKQISKNRNKLLNKKYNFMFNYKFNLKEDYYIDNSTVESTWKGLIKYYDFYNPKFVVAGDGASWIRTLSKYLGAYYIFDKYHALKYLWNEYSPNNLGRKLTLNKEKYNNYKIAKNYFCNGQYNELIEFLTKTKVNKKTLNIFKNNKQGIINQSASWNIGCSAESDIFHLVKSQTKGAKTYNYKTLNNMLISRVNYLNNRI
ncbi:Mbov_0401 family ICE element transposase-like protein [Spiroplasma endosymbiont of Polydrusus pterygomalis]|uniref:Mbov_0401 family ICE element transposase-like protein n=1 Tax=Spiroplasma endosymbiont of Polydrusus pterygomalis TaxID=3139327 RepID=UPI003CCAD4B9